MTPIRELSAFDGLDWSRFWRDVDLALTAVFEADPSVSKRLSRLIEESPQAERLIFYHTGPLDVAARAVGRSVSDSTLRRFARLRRQSRPRPPVTVFVSFSLPDVELFNAVESLLISRDVQVTNAHTIREHHSVAQAAFDSILQADGVFFIWTSRSSQWLGWVLGVVNAMKKPYHIMLETTLRDQLQSMVPKGRHMTLFEQGAAREPFVTQSRKGIGVLLEQVSQSLPESFA